jgi:hypothetical protein
MGNNKKDTILPIKFEKELKVEEVEIFVDLVYNFAETIKTEVTFISMTAVKKRVDKWEKYQKLCCKNFNDSDKVHYEHLIECCNKILDAVEFGKVPKREIMGLKILMNR